MKKYLVVIVLLLTISFITFAQQEDLLNFTCEKTSQLIQEHKNDSNFIIIDLRTKAMFNEERIENAIQFDVFSKEFDDWAKTLDQGKVYLVYSNFGKRSSTAVQKMKELNFEHIYHLYDGLQLWKEKGYATVKEISDFELVKETINNVFGWAVNKDFNLFFNTISDDSNFVSVTPYKRVKFGVKAVINDTAFWASPDFKAIRHELSDLKINFSKSGDVAWFFCMLNDINEWKGQPANWENTRWTGVLEKRNGKWVIVQQHFSFASNNN